MTSIETPKDVDGKPRRGRKKKNSQLEVKEVSADTKSRRGRKKKTSNSVEETVTATEPTFTLNYLMSLDKVGRTEAILEMIARILKFNPKEKGYQWCTELIHYLTGDSNVKIEKYLLKAVEAAPDITESEWRQMMLVLGAFTRTPEFAHHKEKCKLCEDTLYLAGQVLTTAYHSVNNDYKFVRQAVENVLIKFIPLNEISEWIRLREAAPVCLHVSEYWGMKQELLKKLENVRAA